MKASVPTAARGDELSGTDEHARRGLRTFAAAAVTVVAFAVLAVFGGLGGVTGSLTSASAHEYQYGTENVAARVTSIAPVCREFKAGTAAELVDVAYGVRSDGKIGRVNPSAIRYWTQVHAPAAGFTIDVVQTTTHLSFTHLFDLSSPTNVRLHDAACQDVSPASIVVLDDQARVTVAGSAAGKVYYLSVRYGTQPFLSKPAPSPTTVHYDFRTKIDGVVVDGDPNGLDLKKQ